MEVLPLFERLLLSELFVITPTSMVELSKGLRLVLLIDQQNCERSMRCYNDGKHKNIAHWSFRSR